VRRDGAGNTWYWVRQDGGLFDILLSWGMGSGTAGPGAAVDHTGAEQQS
jgi:hypothetical protein